MWNLWVLTGLHCLGALRIRILVGSGQISRDSAISEAPAECGECSSSSSSSGRGTTADDINPLALDYGNCGMFFMMGYAGFVGNSGCGTSVGLRLVGRCGHPKPYTLNPKP